MWSTMYKYCSHLVCSLCKIWSLFFILCVHMQEVTKIFRDAEFPPLGTRHLTPKKHAITTTCYRTKFHCFRSNCLGIHMGPKKFGDAGVSLRMGTWLTSEKYPSAHLHYHVNVGHSRSNHSSVIMEICQNFDRSFTAFQGHWNQHGSTGYL